MRNAPLIIGLIVILLSASGSRTPGLAAQSAAISVTTTQDIVESGDGKCSLREAINNVNAEADVSAGDCAAPGDDPRIKLEAVTYTLDIPTSTEDQNKDGDLDIRSSVSIRGQGMDNTRISNSANGRLFHIFDANVHFSDLEMEGGDAPAGGAIYNVHGYVFSGQVRFSNNTAYGDAGGGAIVNFGEGRMSIQDSHFVGNRTASRGGAILAAGGYIIIQATVFENSEGQNGGALYCQSGNISIYDSVIKDGKAYGSGGGVFNTADLSLIRVSIVGNEAIRNKGGGIYNDGGGILNAVNCTIAENAMTHGLSGGGSAIYNGLGSVRLNFCTLARNTSHEVASAKAAILNSGGLTISNSIIAENEPESCDDWHKLPGSAGYNVFDDKNCKFLATGDRFVTDAGLGNLMDNGRQTLSIMPDETSPAVDIIHSDRCVAEDQRKVRRPFPFDGNCDAGAIEISENMISIIIEGSGSVRDDKGKIDCPSVSCESKYAVEEQVMLEAFPASDFRFARWSGNCTANGNPRPVQVLGEIRCTAIFEHPMQLSAQGRLLFFPYANKYRR